LLVLEEQLAASHHKTEEARVREILLMEDRECAVVARIRQGTIVALVALQLCTDQDFCRVASGFPDHASQAEQVEMVGRFATAAARDILHSGG
jgi:translation elongation factor EF-G